jgi:predicted nucleotidyltransferase
MNILLSGIVGSTAYGLAREGSDIDRLGVYAVDTAELHGLHTPKESHVTTDPDQTLHEARKWCRLALSCNPTVMELVWLDDYEIRTELGNELVAIRDSFLSADRVRNAYIGYAVQQFKRLESRGDGTFSPDLKKRTAKHARHLMRLCMQGLELYAHGTLTIRVEDPEAYHTFGEAVAEDPSVAGELLQHYEDGFNKTTTVLPDAPNEAAVEAWLRKVRATYF